MASFHLQIVTPDAMKFDGQAERVIVRTATGDVCILAGHIDYTAPLAIGQAKVVDAEGNVRHAACNHGFLNVHGGEVRLAAVTFEWADEIDVERAELARSKAEEKLANLDKSDVNYALADARLRRALARLNTSRM